MGGKWQHRLTDDLKCSLCGEVPLVTKHGRLRCKFAVDAQRGKKNPLTQRCKAGVTVAERQFLLSNACEICGSADNLYLDHDHKSGDIRGTLCCACNSALGKFRDSEEILLRAIEYLKKKPLISHRRPEANGVRLDSEAAVVEFLAMQRELARLPRQHRGDPRCPSPSPAPPEPRRP